MGLYKRFLILISFFLGISQSVFSSEPPLTLKDCYDLALKQSETIAIRAEQIKEAEGRFTQALSGILPKIDYVYSDKRQDGSNSSNFTLRDIPEQKFTFSQPLFSGFKEFAAMAASKADRREKKYQKLRAEQLLFLDVVNAYYLFLGYQEEQQALGNIHQALTQRVAELKKREELGRSRPSEVASVESRLSRIEADIEFSKSEFEISKQLLEFLSGTEIPAIVNEEIPGEIALTPENIPFKAERRPDVLAAKETWEKSKKEVTIAQSGFWPKVSLDGNYYTERVGNAGNVDWDVALTAQVPLFEGGENLGKLKEAKSLRTQEELRYQETTRKAVLEIHNASTRWESSLRRRQATQKALDAAEKNYQLQKEDYQRSLVNNLEVLQAMEDAEDMRRNFININNETKRNYWQLKVAIGDPLL